MKANLLIVDDDANTLASLSRAFRLAGHEATVCDNPIKALEMIKAEKFDVIFSDVVMPGMDGLSLLEQIKAAGVATPVVMMSGQAHIEMAVKATRLGALDFLEKPISTDKLLLTVQNALQLERLKQENQQLRQQLGGVGHRLHRREDAQAAGAGGARGRQRDARLHPGRDRHGQGADRADDPRKEPAPRRTVRHAELRGGAGGAD